MSARCDTIIFDLDGTLLDTLPDLTAAVNYAMTQMRFNTRTIDEIHSFVGDGIRKLIERSLPPNVSANDTEQALSLFRQYYDAHLSVNTQPYPGIIDLLQTLHNGGIKIGICSNKADFAVQKLNKIYFAGLDILAVGESDNMPRKPDPSMVSYLRGELHSENVLYVGDSDTDVRTACNAGVEQISVLWGYRSRQQLQKAGAVRFAQTPQDIAAAVNV